MILLYNPKVMKEEKAVPNDVDNIIESLKSENEALKQKINILAANEVSSISGEYRAQPEHQDSTDRFQAVFECSSLGNKIISLDLKILQVNPALVELLGYNRKEDLIGTRILDYSPLDHRQHWQTLQENFGRMPVHLLAWKRP